MPSPKQSNNQQVIVTSGLRAVELATGQDVFPGKVVLSGFAALEYDYVVNVDVDADEAAPVWAEQVTVTRRAGGKPIRARDVAAEIDRVERTAVQLLSAKAGALPMFDRAGAVSPKMARRLLTQKPPRISVETVAKAYRKAWGTSSTTAAVASALGVTPGAARWWIHRARQAGALPPATSTRPQRG